MKLARYGQPGAEKPALVDANGKLRDASKLVDGDYGPAFFASGGNWLPTASSISATSLSVHRPCSAARRVGLASAAAHAT